MQIRLALPEDAEALTSIAHAAKRHWDYPERWIAEWRDALTVEADFIRSNTTFVAMEGGNPIGFYALSEEQDQLWLDRLWIIPAAMGRGVGRALFTHAVDQARKFGRRLLFIESDPNAEGFYHRMGAQRIGANMTSIDGGSRELPLLQYDLG
jgi:GNAT superfamily N-acetyltransferase